MLEWLEANNPPGAELLAAHLGRVDQFEELSCEGIPSEGDWPAQPATTDRLPSSVFDTLTQRAHDCLLAVVATADPTTVPAYLQFGGFNSCPSSAVHVAFLRDWNRRFGAVPICVTHDVIEIWVPRPPLSREEAMSLAGELARYAPDIVHQGTQTVGRLAMELWQSPYWYFWWD
jgi:hypothetical protein